MWSGERAKNLKARWSSDQEFRNLKFWEDLFRRVSSSDFLMGKSCRGGKYNNWKADLAWIVKQSNFAKIVEGKYDNNLGQTQNSGPSGYDPLRGVK
jgi:hypothetical protein